MKEKSKTERLKFLTPFLFLCTRGCTWWWREVLSEDRLPERVSLFHVAPRIKLRLSSLLSVPFPDELFNCPKTEYFKVQLL